MNNVVKAAGTPGVACRADLIYKQEDCVPVTVESCFYKLLTVT